MNHSDIGYLDIRYLVSEDFLKKPALIIIDMIEDGFDGWDAKIRQSLTENINQLSDFFRSKKLPIVWIRQEFEPNLSDAFLEMRQYGIKKYIKGTPGVKILSELKVLDSENVVVKKRYSGFFETSLDQILRECNVDSLVLAGINTHACIRTTAIDAYQRDWKVILAADCINSYNQDWHESSLDYMKGRIASYLTKQQLEESLGAHA